MKALSYYLLFCSFVISAWSQDTVVDVNPQQLSPRVHLVQMLEPVPIQNVIGRELLRLKCSASGNPAPAIEWSLNGVKFVKDQSFGGIDNPIRHTITGNSFTLSQIDGIRDSGRYRCIATNALGSVFLEKNIKIRVLGQFKPGARYNDPTVKLYPTIGRKFIMQCPPHTTGHGTIYRWGTVPERTNSPAYAMFGRPYSTGFPMSGGRFGFSYMKADIITLSRDTGGIRCILFNYGIITSSVQLVLWRAYKTVSETRKPILIQHMMPQMTAVVNTEFTMSCAATGFPEPVITWQYQGTDIKSRWNNGSRELNFEFFNLIAFDHVLKIRRTTKYSGGTFKCFATNSLGTSWKIGQLTITFPPKWLTFLPDSVEVPLENSYEYNCTASGVPAPLYEWYHNGSLVKNTLHRTVDKGYLLIKKAIQEDDGIYICLAINPLDTLTQSTYVKVKAVAPQFEMPVNDPIYLFRTSTMYVLCKVKGGPIPKITWFKDDIQIVDQNRFTILDDGSLQIDAVNRNDEGVYKCVAENYRGIAESSGTAITLEPTVITHPPMNLTYQVGWPYASLFCGASWDESLDLRIEWYKGGVKMAKFDDRIYLESRASGPPRVLYLHDLRITDAGIYSCHAYTKVGDVISEEWRSSRLTIKGPPEPPAGVTISGDCYTYNAQIQWARGEELGVETRRFFIEFATNITEAQDIWFAGNKPNEVLYTEPGTITYYDLDQTNLPPGANLTFRVRAGSDHLIGRPSRPSKFGNCITPPGPPIMNPINVSENILGTGLFGIKWVPITDVHFGAKGFYYELGYKKVQDTDFTIVEINDPMTSTFNVENAGIYEEYEFYVRSVNILGKGPAPVIHKAFSGKIKPSEVPKNIRVGLILRFSVELQWEPVKDADGYRVAYWNISDSESQRGHTPDYFKRKRRSTFDETYNVRYKFFYGKEFSNGAPLSNISAEQDFMTTVAAVNTGGVGPESQVVEFTTAQRVPGKPSNVNFQIFGPSAKLSWHPPLDPNGYIEEYNVFWYRADPHDRTQTGALQFRSYLRRDREAYMIDTFEPMRYYNVKLSARNRMGRGQEWERILVAVSADDIPGKPDAPTVTPFDDTALNVTFRMSSYGGLPTKFKVLVRMKGKYYKAHTIYEQEFPKRAWVLVQNLKHVIYDIHTIGINSLGQSETSDVTEQRPIPRPKFQAHSNGIQWWRTNWFIMFLISMIFIFVLTATVFVALRKTPVVLYQALLEDDDDQLYEEYEAMLKVNQTNQKNAAMLNDEPDVMDRGMINPKKTDSIVQLHSPPAYRSKSSFGQAIATTESQNSRSNSTSSENNSEKSKYSDSETSSETEDSYSSESEYSTESGGSSTMKKQDSYTEEEEESIISNDEEEENFL